LNLYLFDTELFTPELFLCFTTIKIYLLLFYLFEASQYLAVANKQYRDWDISQMKRKRLEAWVRNKNSG